MFIGAVKWFDNVKGFGLLVLPQQQTLFLHIRGFQHPPGLLKTGDVVLGERKKDDSKGREVATSCSLAQHPAAWSKALALLPQPDVVYFTFPAPEHGIYQASTKLPHKHSLLLLTLGQLWSALPEDRFMKMITFSYDKELLPEQFLPYARFLESSLPIVAGTEKGGQLLRDVFRYFGQHIRAEILFLVWKEQQFQYIGYEGGIDYEIPEEILNIHATEIGLPELERIKHYSCAASFCSGFIPALLENLDGNYLEDKELLLPYLKFLEEGEQAVWKQRLAIS